MISTTWLKPSGPTIFWVNACTLPLALLRRAAIRVYAITVSSMRWPIPRRCSATTNHLRQSIPPRSSAPFTSGVIRVASSSRS